MCVLHLCLCLCLYLLHTPHGTAAVLSGSIRQRLDIAANGGQSLPGGIQAPLASRHLASGTESIYKQEENIQANALDGYKASVAPLIDDLSTPLYVTTNLDLTSLLGVDIKSSTASFSVILTEIWTDKRLGWNKTEYPDVEFTSYFASPAQEDTQIWTPR